MEEKVIIRSEIYSLKECLEPIRFIILALTGVLTIIVALLTPSAFFGPIITGLLTYLIVALIVRIVYNIWIKKCEMLVADTSVCWSGPFGVSCCLPLDMISSIKAQKFLGINAVIASTPSMRISFGFFKNAQDIYSALAEKLYLRQNNK